MCGTKTGGSISPTNCTTREESEEESCFRLSLWWERQWSRRWMFHEEEWKFLFIKKIWERWFIKHPVYQAIWFSLLKKFIKCSIIYQNRIRQTCEIRMPIREQLEAFIGKHLLERASIIRCTSSRRSSIVPTRTFTIWPGPKTMPRTQETVLQPGLRLNCHFDFGKLDSESNASRKWTNVCSGTSTGCTAFSERHLPIHAISSPGRWSNRSTALLGAPPQPEIHLKQNQIRDSNLIFWLNTSGC